MHITKAKESLPQGKHAAGSLFSYTSSSAHIILSHRFHGRAPRPTARRESAHTSHYLHSTSRGKQAGTMRGSVQERRTPCRAQASQHPVQAQPAAVQQAPEQAASAVIQERPAAASACHVQPSANRRDDPFSRACPSDLDDPRHDAPPCACRHRASSPSRGFSVSSILR